MRLRSSLRTRFVAALLTLASILSAGYYLSVHRIVELVEIELQQRALDRELAELAAALARDPQAALPQRAHVRVYWLREATGLDALPPPLRRLREGRHRELVIDGRRFQAARRDIGSGRLVLAHDIEDIEALERRLVTLAWLVVGCGLLVAVGVGLLLAQAVTRPVARLATAVSNLDPARRGHRLGSGADDPYVRQIAAAFDRYLDRLDQFVAREQAFSDEASHELRTPLAVIEGALHLMRRQAVLDEPNRQRLARIGRATAQMHSVIEALLYLSRAGGGGSAEPVALDEVLAEVCDSHRQLLEGRQVDVTCEILAPRQVRVPRGMVLCVVNNLVSNAIRSTVRGRVQLRLEADAIVVADTGSGIPDADLPHIFELGYRGRQSRGSGLGLHLVQRICKQLDWHISVHSAAGQGTEFRVVTGG